MRKIADQVHWDTLTHFIAVPDHVLHPDEFDHWMSHADAVEAGLVFRDDCDGFALTCAELLLRRGVDPARVKLIFCRVETGESHLVCGCDVYILDNRQRRPTMWDMLSYEWVKSMRLNERGTWRKMS